MKKLILATFISLVLILCSCGGDFAAEDGGSQKNEKDGLPINDYYINGGGLTVRHENTYEINTEVFEEKDSDSQLDIEILYPQITGLGTSLQDRINELIKEAALRPYFDIQDDTTEGTEWPVTYSVMYATDKLLSIQFEGYIYTRGSAHGTNWVYSVNINLTNGQVINIDDLFDHTFKSRIDISYFAGVDTDSSHADTEAINELFRRYHNNFTSSTDNFYFTADKFVVILPIASDYQFAAEYQDLRESMKEDHPLWDDVLR